MIDVNDILKRFDALSGVRNSYWLDLWRQARRYVMPNDQDDVPEGGNRSADKHISTPVLARQRLASGIYAWLLDPSKRMIELVPANRDLKDLSEVKDYFAELTRAVIELVANSNYTSAVLQMLNTCCTGIDGVIFADDPRDDGKLNLRCIPTENCCYTENARGSVESCFRELKLSSRQLVEEFGHDGHLPDSIRTEAADPARMDSKHDLVHAVFPRRNHDNTLDRIAMPFADVYILKKERIVIYEGGFNEFPFIVCRFEKSPHESYGRGPGINMLPDIKQLDRMKKSLVLAVERSADPDTLVPSNSIADEPWDRRPGAVHLYDPGASGVKPEYMIYPAQPERLAQLIADTEDAIKRGFYWDVFDPLGDLKQITATEAEIRNEGKLVPFSTIVGNIQSDFLEPLVNRCVGILARSGKLPEPPDPILADPDYKIECVSRIALAIRQNEAAAWVRVEAATAGIKQLHPDVEDNIDYDRAFRDIFLAGGANPEWLRSDKDRDELRAARQQAQQQQQQIEALSAAADAVPKLSAAPDPGSMIDQMQSFGGMR